jgi:hypothetical protein
MIDVDDGNVILHFKAINEVDFAKLLEIIAAIGSEIKKTTQEIGPAHEIDQILLLLLAESQNMSELMLAKREDGNEAVEESESVKNTHELLNRIKTSMILYHASVDLLKEQLQFSDALFKECLLENNEFRKDNGKDPVSKADFMRMIGSISTPHSRMFTASSELLQSINLDDSIFFDAGENYSLFCDDEGNPIAEDDLEEEFLSMADEDEDSKNEDAVIAVFDKVVDQSSSICSDPSFVRRRNLPCPTISMENVSIMSLLRTNVGKDLSQVAMPLALNEPLNLLQRLCEELEYSDLLVRADAASDPIERNLLVAAFAVSAYASTLNRSGRKPFNPLLGIFFYHLIQVKPLNV